jgi:hypothetical protein
VGNHIENCSLTLYLCAFSMIGDTAEDSGTGSTDAMDIVSSPQEASTGYKSRILRNIEMIGKYQVRCDAIVF